VVGECVARSPIGGRRYKWSQRVTGFKLFVALAERGEAG
jgi:hypothetical protein